MLKTHCGAAFSILHKIRAMQGQFTACATTNPSKEQEMMYGDR